VKIETRFHFRRVSPTVFEILSPNDPAASDQPHLENLLAQDRRDEVKRCFSTE